MKGDGSKLILLEREVWKPLGLDTFCSIRSFMLQHKHNLQKGDKVSQRECYVRRKIYQAYLTYVQCSYIAVWKEQLNNFLLCSFMQKLQKFLEFDDQILPMHKLVYWGKMHTFTWLIHANFSQYANHTFTIPYYRFKNKFTKVRK